MQWETVEHMFSDFFQSDEDQVPSFYPASNPENLEDFQIMNEQEKQSDFVYFDPVQSEWMSKVGFNSFTKETKQ